MPEPLSAYRLPSPGSPISRSQQWPDSVAWIDSWETELTSREYGDFLLSVSVPLAIDAGNRSSAVKLIFKALRHARPGLPALTMGTGLLLLSPPGVASPMATPRASGDLEGGGVPARSRPSCPEARSRSASALSTTTMTSRWTRPRTDWSEPLSTTSSLHDATESWAMAKRQRRLSKSQAHALGVSASSRCARDGGGLDQYDWIRRNGYR